MRRLLVICALALAFAAPAHAFTKQTGTRTMDDGVQLAYDLYEPDGAAPAGGWPGVVVLHGLGGTKEQVALVATFFADHGYAALAYTARGHGTSGGNVELASPRETTDERAIFDWFRALPEVTDRVGAWGISYGGGQVLNGLVAGIPYLAADVLETWTDLYSALWPSGVAKSGVVLGFAKLIEARSPLIASFENDAARSRNLASIRPLLAERSPLAGLASVRTPVYMFQGRMDFAFDVAQATQGYARLAGPKHLYVGAFGHSPSTFPGPDIDFVLTQSLAWLDRYVRGQPNGIENTAPVSVATRGTRRTFKSLPPTRTLTLRPGARAPTAVTTWGGGSVVVQVKKLGSYPRLVARVTANGAVVTHGAVVPHLGKVTIPLASYVVDIPKRAKIAVRLGPESGVTDLAYLGFGDAGSISLGRPTLNLSVLR